jgi:tetratricopeptide (TPR) repeat protein
VKGLPIRIGLAPLALLVLLAGCGGQRSAKTPASAQATEQTANAGVAAEEAAEPEGSGRPEDPAMTAEAASAYGAGMLAFNAGDMKGAQAQFARAVAIDPRAYPAQCALGIIEERSNDPARALESYAKALAISPTYGPAIAARVRLLEQLGRNADAETFVRDLSAKYPEDAAVLTALGEVKSARGDSNAAQELAQKALKKDPDYRPAMLTLARDHYRARRLDLALYTLTAILDGYGEENPPRDRNNADARLLRALIYREQGKRKAAMEELSKILSLRADLVEARLYLAAYMLEAGNAAEARPLLEDALKYEPSNVLVHLNLGDAYRLLGKPKDALDHLSWVTRKDANLAQAHYNLGLVYLFSSDVPGMSEPQAIDRAIESFERFKKLQPRAARGQGDDVDELIARARSKKAILEALQQKPATPAAGQTTGGSG